MSWNDPGKENDRWSPKGQPPDLDEAFKKLQRRIKKILSNSSSPSVLNKNDENNFRKLGGFATFIIIALWLVSGIFIVDPAEQAAILRFGKYIKTVGPGPHWILPLLESKTVLNVDRVSDYSYSAQMLTRDENLVSVAVAVQYKIGDLQDYLFNVVDAEEGLRQATSSALRQVVGTTTLDQLITEGRDAWGSSVQDTLMKILASYKAGIIIVNVSPQPARAPENVQDAFDDAIKAQEDEKRFKEQAGAYAARVVPIAEGNAKRIYEESYAFAKRVVLKAKGETAEFLDLLPIFIKSPYVTEKRMYLDAMQQILSNTTKVVLDSKASNMIYLPWEQLLRTQNLSSSLPATSSDIGLQTKMRALSQDLALDNSTASDNRNSFRPVIESSRRDSR
jgi:modulator of FtsH protease HflK